MCAMHAPVSPRHDVVPHVRMLCVDFAYLRRFRHNARLRCIFRVRGSFSFVTTKVIKGSVVVAANLSFVVIKYRRLLLVCLYHTVMLRRARSTTSVPKGNAPRSKRRELSISLCEEKRAMLMRCRKIFTLI